MFTDGKFNFFSEKIGGTINENFSITNYLELNYRILSYLKNVFPDKSIEYPNRKYASKFNSENFSVELPVQFHTGSDHLPTLIRTLVKASKGEIKNHCKVTGVKDNGLNFSLEFENAGNKQIIRCDEVVFATGQASSEKSIQVMQSLGAEIEHAKIVIGARVEGETETFEKLLKIAYDPKIYMHTKKGTVRTFCTNPGGYLVTEQNKSFCSVNGYAKAGVKSKKTNFALVMNIADQSILENLKYVFKEKTFSGNFKEFSKNKDILRVSKEAQEGIVEAVEILSKEFGIDSSKIKLHFPEVKMYSNKVSVKKDVFRTKNKNLYVIGDATGGIRGLTTAAASGISLGELAFGGEFSGI